MPTKPSMEYKVEGGRHGRFIIRSCFGGNNANFIASGSEVGTMLGATQRHQPVFPFLSSPSK